MDVKSIQCRGVRCQAISIRNMRQWTVGGHVFILPARFWGLTVDSIDQRLLKEILALPIASDRAKPFYQRVAAQRSWRAIELEAILATIEAVTRKLRTRGWKRCYTSNRKRDGHADSRYYRNGSYEIRSAATPIPIRLIVISSTHHHTPSSVRIQRPRTRANDLARSKGQMNRIETVGGRGADQRGVNSISRGK